MFYKIKKTAFAYKSGLFILSKLPTCPSADGQHCNLRKSTNKSWYLYFESFL